VVLLVLQTLAAVVVVLVMRVMAHKQVVQEL
jgi:hypothetical protein